MKADRYLIAAETRDMPGKVKLTFVRFETEYVPMDTFENRTFALLDPELPEARVLASLFRNK